MVGVFVLAISTIALLNANQFWVAVSGGCALLLLFIALLGAILTKHVARAFWTGIAVFGWGYAVLFHTPFGLTDASYYPSTLALEALHRAIGSPAEEWLSRELEHANQIPDADPVEIQVHGPDRSRMRISYLKPLGVPFKQVGHWLFTLLFALLGGAIARAMYRRYDTKRPIEPGS